MAVDLEAIVDRKLKQLPAPRAPHTLLPRVLHAVREWAERPWYARAWLTWPVGWQIASVLTLVLLMGSVLWIWPYAQAAASGAASRLAARTGDLPHIAQRVEAATHAGRVLWRALVQPVATLVVVVLMLMCVVCVAFGTMLNRVAIGKA